MIRAKYIVEQRTARSLVIRDVGGQRDCSVTNDAEAVVDDLWVKGLIREGVLLFYYDSDGRLDQLRHSCGVFTDFAPGPRDGVVP